MHIVTRLKKSHFLPLLALPVFFACNGKKDQAASQQMQMNQVKDYKVMEIQPREFTVNSEFPATIEGQQNVEIRPKIDGYIEEIYVDEGATVRKGQKLFKISAPQYEQEVRTARANIEIAEADVKAAEMDVNKVKPLVEKNIISKYELEAAEYNLQSKKARLAQAKATLANAQTNLGYTIVTSPVNGVIGTLPFKIGSLVSSNTTKPLTTVSNIKNIYAYFSINEKEALEFSRNANGKSVENQLNNMPPVSLVLANGVEFGEKGKIETTSGVINTETGSLSVRATFPNPGNKILSGSSGIVKIPTHLKNALLVPQRSTYEIQGKQFVYSLSDSNTVNSTQIDIRKNTGGQFFVVMDGLKPGDVVVVEGVATLREGQKIEPVMVNADSVLSIKSATDSIPAS